ERPHVGRITLSKRLGRDLDRLEISGAEDDDERVAAVLLGQALDPILVLGVHRARRRSDEALGLDEDHLRTGRADAVGDRGTGNAVPLAERDHLLAVELHAASPPLSVANACSRSCLPTSPVRRSISTPSRISTYVG